MRLTDTRICKVTKHRIFSVAVHPTTSQLLVSAGDKWGGVGIWNIVSVKYVFFEQTHIFASFFAVNGPSCQFHRAIIYKLPVETEVLYSLPFFTSSAAAVCVCRLNLLLVPLLSYTCTLALCFSLLSLWCALGIKSGARWCVLLHPTHTAHQRHQLPLLPIFLQLPLHCQLRWQHSVP